MIFSRLVELGATKEEQLKVAEAQYYGEDMIRLEMISMVMTMKVFDMDPSEAKEVVAGRVRVGARGAGVGILEPTPAMLRSECVRGASSLLQAQASLLPNACPPLHPSSVGRGVCDWVWMRVSMDMCVCTRVSMWGLLDACM